MLRCLRDRNSAYFKILKSMRWNEPVVSKTSPELPVVAFPVTVVTWPESPESAVLLEAISISPVLLEVPVAAPESS